MTKDLKGIAMKKEPGQIKDILLRVITISFDILLLIIAVMSVYIRGIDNIKNIWILNIGMDMIGLVLGLMITLFCYVDYRKGIQDYRYFRYLVQVADVGILADVGAWVYDGAPELRTLNLISNTFFYLATPILIFFLWLYTKQLIGRTDADIEKFDRFVKLGTFIVVVLCIINIHGGFFFYIDDASNYVRGPLYPLFMGFSFLSALLVLIIIIAKRKWFTTRQMIVLIIYIFTPLPTVVISMIFYGISVNNVMIMLDILLMYSLLNVEQGRQKLVVEKELTTAASIQEGVLPNTFPLFPERNEFDIYAIMNPAKEIGGDFYDAFMVDDDHLALVVADVAGKGIPAALFMLITRTLIKSRAQMGGTPSEIIKDVNLRLYEDNKAKMFVTIWMVIVEVSTGHVMEVNAGHECPAIKRVGGKFELIRSKHDFVVGGRKKTKFTDHEYDLSPGDIIFCYTDGVPEACKANMEMLGTGRMIDILNEHRHATPSALLTYVRDRVDAFVCDAPQFDDMTMMAFYYKGK